MNATKERHSITMSPLAWTILNKLKAIQKKSISSILEESLIWLPLLYVTMRRTRSLQKY